MKQQKPKPRAVTLRLWELPTLSWGRTIHSVLPVVSGQTQTFYKQWQEILLWQRPRRTCMMLGPLGETSGYQSGQHWWGPQHRCGRGPFWAKGGTCKDSIWWKQVTPLEHCLWRSTSCRGWWGEKNRESKDHLVRGAFSSLSHIFLAITIMDSGVRKLSLQILALTFI